MTIKESVKNLAKSSVRSFIAVSVGTLQYLDDLANREIFEELARDNPEIARSLDQVYLFSIDKGVATPSNLYPSWREFVVGQYHNLKEMEY